MMKKILAAILLFVCVLSLTACGAKEPEHKLAYVECKRMTLFEQYDCVAVFTQYTNGSSQSAVPADYISVKAYQNGVELPPLVPTGDKTDGYIQCDAGVQSGITADVVWIFQLDDESPVSIEMPGGEKHEFPLS